MKYTLKVVNSKDYDRIAEKYPHKIRDRIKNSWGFTDTKNGMSVVRSRRKKIDVAAVALHEILEMAAKISPHDIDGIRLKGKESNEVQYTSPPQSKLYSEIQEPWLKSMYSLWQNLYEPTTRQLGGLLQTDLTEPFSPELSFEELTMPEDEWQEVWKKRKESALAEYPGIEKRMTERFAGSGALDTSGQVQKAFKDIEFQKAKSVETAAADQAIAEWQEKKSMNLYNTEKANEAALRNWQQSITGKQQSYQNIFSLLGMQPSFNIPYSTSQPYTSSGSSSSGFNLGGLFGGGLAGGLGASMAGLGGPMTALAILAGMGSGAFS